MSFNPFLGKAEIEHQRNFENLSAVYLRRCKNAIKLTLPKPRV